MDKTVFACLLLAVCCCTDADAARRARAARSARSCKVDDIPVMDDFDMSRLAGRVWYETYVKLPNYVTEVWTDYAQVWAAPQDKDYDWPWDSDEDEEEDSDEDAGMDTDSDSGQDQDDDDDYDYDDDDWELHRVNVEAYYRSPEGECGTFNKVYEHESGQPAAKWFTRRYISETEWVPEDQWIIGTNYESWILVYSCTVRNTDNGECDSAAAWIWSRAPTLSDVDKASAMALVPDLCLTRKDFLESTAGDEGCLPRATHM